MLFFLDHYSGANDVEHDVSDYLLKLYLVVERVYEVLDIMGLIGQHCPKDGRIPLEFRTATDGMKAMREVKQWANFLKHPGAFLWCHGPVYHCESLGLPKRKDEMLVIDQELVNVHYRSDVKKHKELYKKIANKSDVHVFYPELINLTERFCSGIKDFCDTATSPLFLPFLRDRSTYENFFEFLDEAVDPRN